MNPRTMVPAAVRVMLWVGGTAGLLFTILGALGGSAPGRETSHLLGVLIFGCTSIAALLAAWLLSRRPRIGRAVGLVAAGGALFIGWLLTQSSSSGLAGVSIGILIAAIGAYVAWQLSPWSRRKSSESE